MCVLLFLETAKLFSEVIVPFYVPSSAWRVPVPPRGSGGFRCELLLLGWSAQLCGGRRLACCHTASRGVGRQPFLSAALPHALYVIK